MSPVDMNRALGNDEAYAFKLWRTYNNGNPYGLTDVEYGEIVGHWQSHLKIWESYKEDDDNNYVVTDDDWNNGQERAESDSGFKNTKHKENMQSLRTVGDATASVAGAVGGHYLNKSENLTMNVAKKGETANTQSAGVLISCAKDAALALWYRLAKPNKEQADAIKVYDEQMPVLMDECDQDVADMATYDEELMDLTNLASETVETTNEEMEAGLEEYMKNQSIVEYAKSAVTQGCELDESDKKEYASSIENMTLIGEEVDTLREDTIEQVGEINEEMLPYEDDYAEVAHNMGERAGYTAAAADLDDQTQVKCYFEVGSQTLNAGAAAIDAKKALSVANGTSMAWYVAALYYVAAGFAAISAVSDGLAAKEQFDMAKDIGKEIDDRKEVEDANAAAIDLHDEYVDNFDGYLTVVGGQEIVEPDGLDEPDPTLPEPPEDPDKKDPKKDKNP